MERRRLRRKGFFFVGRLFNRKLFQNLQRIDGRSFQQETRKNKVGRFTLQKERKKGKVLRDGFAAIDQRTNDILFNTVELSNFSYKDLLKMPVWEFYGVVKRLETKQKAIKDKLKQSSNGRKHRR